MEFVPGFIEHIEELLVDIIFDPKHNLTCYHYCPTQYEKIELWTVVLVYYSWHEND